MIVDAFSFFNELDTLEIRLNYLDDKVDKFVILESNITYSGDAKPFYFDENKERFRKFFPKMEHYMVKNLSPPGPHPFGPRWVPENNQRRAIKDALLSMNLDDEDWILVGDLDEIPKKELLDSQKGVFDTWSYLYYLNVTSDEWVTTCVYLQWKEWKNKDFQEVRNIRHNMHHKRGGWHFSWQGGLDRVRHKLKSFAHTELDNPKIHNELEGKFNTITSFFCENLSPMRAVPIDDSFPDYLVKNQDKYRHMIYPVE